MTNALMEKKRQMRKEFVAIREQLSSLRRKEAEEQCYIELINRVQSKRFVLSFYSIGSEINLFLINQFLEEEKRLVLPSIVNGVIVPFLVQDIAKELKPGPFKGLLEPDTAICRKISLKELESVFIPGLVFDKKGFRIGYGKGYYDRLLARLNDSIPSYGIGFKEQLSNIPIPKDQHDQKVKELLLF